MEIIFSVKGMYCSACKGTVEKAVNSLSGVKKAEANTITNSLEVVFDEKLTKVEDIINIAGKEGYVLTVMDDEDDLIKKNDNSNILLKIFISVIIMIPLMYFGMSGMYQNAIPTLFLEKPYIMFYIECVLSLVIILIFFINYKRGFLALIHLHPNMDSLVFLGSFFSFGYSLYLSIKYTINVPSSLDGINIYFDSAAMILIFINIGKYIEGISKNKAKSSLNELLKLRPKIAHVYRNNELFDIETKYLQKGDKILVKSGENIPMDGLAIKGETTVDESFISGESMPILKKEDDYVYGGSIVNEGVIEVVINKNKNESLLSKIIKLVSEASNSKTKLTHLVDKISGIFCPIVICVAVITFLCWLLIHPELGVDKAFNFGASVLVISCPCALGLATPISLLVGSSVFSKNGILVNNSEAIEKTSKINCLVLDKTNTITKGSFKVIKYKDFNEKSGDLNRILSLESSSNHPLAIGISRFLVDKKPMEKPEIVKNIPGFGIKGSFKGDDYFVGNLKFYENNCHYKDQVIEDLNKINSSKGHQTIIAFTVDRIIGVFVLEDELKEGSKEFIKYAKKHFKKVVLLTGDNQTVASNVAEDLNITDVYAEINPIKKMK